MFQRIGWGLVFLCLCVAAHAAPALTWTLSPKFKSGQQYMARAIITEVGTADWVKVYENGALLVSATNTYTAGMYVTRQGNQYITYTGTGRLTGGTGEVGSTYVTKIYVEETDAPDAPTGVAVSNVTTSGFTVSWNAVVDRSPGKTDFYKIYIDGSYVTWTRDLSLVITQAITVGQTYNVTVSAVDYAENESAQSAAGQVYIAPGGGGDSGGGGTGGGGTGGGGGGTSSPSASIPAGVRAYDASAVGFSVSWSPQTAQIDHYNVYVYLNGALHVTKTSNTNFAAVSGLSSSTTYTVEVSATGTDGLETSHSVPVTIATVSPIVFNPSLNSIPSFTAPVATGPNLVGAAGGEIHVDNHGAATYSIPLRVAPGRSGMEPQLSLSYSSGSGNGVVGVGWSLSTGLPGAITRGRSILARDQEVRGVNFDANDHYYLDGKRLVRISGVEGAAGSAYRTEVDSFANIMATGTGAGIDMFTMQDKNGRTYIFGKLDGASDGFQKGGGETGEIAYSYALKRVEDSLGNYIALSYADLGGGEYVLQKVEYTGGIGIAPLCTVELGYEERIDQPVTYVAGRSFYHRARLGLITSKINLDGTQTGTAVYKLGYSNPSFAASSDSGRSRLTSVGAMFLDPNSSVLCPVPSTTITWTQANVELAEPTLVTIPGVTLTPADIDNGLKFADWDNSGKDKPLANPNTDALGGSPSVLLFPGDFNGDGKKEVLEVTFGPQWHWEDISAGMGLGESFRRLFRDDVAGGSLVLRREMQGVASRITVADFTGDGRDDLLVHSYEGYGYLFVSNGTALAEPIKSANAFGAAAGTRQDVFGLPGAQNQKYVMSVATCPYVRPFPVDLNGDGMVDYAWIEIQREVFPNSNGEITGYFNFRLANAVLATKDGRFSTPSTINAFPSTVVGAFSSQTHIRFEDVYAGILPGDYNGDGMTDFLVLDNKGMNSSSRWVLVLSRGQGTNGSPLFQTIIAPIPGSLAIGGASVNTYYRPVTQEYWAGTISMPFTLNSQQPLQIFAGIENSNASINTFVNDVNHDGLSDLVWYVAADTNDALVSSSVRGWYALLSTGKFSQATASTPGSGFVGPVRLTHLDGISGGIPLGAPGAPSYVQGSRINASIDVNGDGFPDVHFQDTRNNRPQTLGSVYNLRAAGGTGSPSFADLTQAITDGIGRSDSVVYKAAKDDLIYTPGVVVSYPIREVRSAAPVVSDVYKDSGGTAPAHFSYQYAGNRLDLSGRGLLGFHAFITEDRQTNVFKYQFLAQSFPMTGLASREQTYRYWESSTETNFRLISTHDNTVVFDEVVDSVSNTSLGTVFPFISKAIESRYEDSSVPHFTLGKGTPTGTPDSRATELFSKALPPDAHITVLAKSWFDSQDLAAEPQTTLPGVTGYNPSDAVSMPGLNIVAGTNSFSVFDTLPRRIKFGNLRKLLTDYGDGHTESAVTTYKNAPGGTNLTGLVDTLSTSVKAPGFDLESAPSKSYTYFGSTPLVLTETLDSTDDRLDLKTEHVRDNRGRITSTTVTGMDLLSLGAGAQSIRTYKAETFDDRFDLPTLEKNAYNYETNTSYSGILAKPTSLTDVNGQEIQTTYDALGRVARVYDVLKGLSTDTGYIFDTSQVVGSGVVDGGLTISSAYRIQVNTTKKPAIYTYYDRVGRQIRSIRDNFNGSTATDLVYNNLGQIVATSNPYPSGGTALWTKSEFDPLGRLKKSTAPNGTITTTSYNGRATSVTVDAPSLGGTDPAPQTNTTVVDAKGRTVKVWNADNVPAFSDTKGTSATEPSIAFGLDGFGRMRSTTLRGQSQVITASYDGFGRQTSLCDPDKGNWTYVNSSLGYVLQQTDGRSTVTTTVYDELGRSLTRTTQESGGPKEVTDWYYYSSGLEGSKPHLVAKGEKGWIGAVERDETVTTGAEGYTAIASQAKSIHYYDAKGRPSIDLNQIDGKFFYTCTDYDAYSRVQSVRHYWKPSPLEEPGVSPYLWRDFGYTYSYDDRSYLTQVKDSADRIWWAAASTTSYDFLDRPVRIRKGPSYWTQRTYRIKTEYLPESLRGR
jgi:YD repeat-containing protein